MEAVQYHPDSRSFGWSDFPLIGESLRDVKSSTFQNPTEKLPTQPHDTEAFHTETSESFRSSQEDYFAPSKPFTVEAFSDDTVSTASIDSLSDAGDDVASSSSVCTTTTTAPQNEPKRGVSFSHFLQVRTYQVVLGDHPCCTGGMALECGWKYSSEEMLDLDTFEQAQGPRRRRLLQLHMSYGERRSRLQRCTGLSGAELLTLEYKLCCGSNEPQQPQQQQRQPQDSKPSKLTNPTKRRERNMYKIPYSRPLHHAGSFATSLDQQPLKQQSYPQEYYYTN